MSEKANGSLIKKDNQIIGSRLIGQKFIEKKYFQGRPSAVDYDAGASGASNLGPTSKKLIETVADRIVGTRLTNVISDNIQIPADMVLTSASGLDPHIGMKNALLQVPRIAKIRNIAEAKVIQLVEQCVDRDFIGLWGQSAVNVLQLNIALDNIKG
jgi:K+-transporting ATPase ATPase C chain